jgi:hypothetical protein
VATWALAESLGHHDPAFILRVYTHLMPASERRARLAIDTQPGGVTVTVTGDPAGRCRPIWFCMPPKVLISAPGVTMRST